MCVVSLKGRDRGHLFYVVGEAPNRLLVADGRLHPTRRPKAKNPRHLKPVPLSTKHLDTWARERRTPEDHELRRELETLGSEGEGGAEDL